MPARSRHRRRDSVKADRPHRLGGGGGLRCTEAAPAELVGGGLSPVGPGLPSEVPAGAAESACLARAGRAPAPSAPVTIRSARRPYRCAAEGHPEG